MTKEVEFEVQQGLEIDRRTFSARLQNAARRAAPDLFVMTQANIETLVRAAGKTLAQCEGQCAVDTGKLIGADLVITGRIARVGRTFVISMQMYDTAKGELIAGEDVESKTEDDLLKVSAEATERLLVSLSGGQSAAAPAAAGAASPPLPAPMRGHAAQGTIKVVSNPAGAKVAIDGDAVGATPLTVKRDAGTYVVSVELSGYAPVSRQIEIAARKTAVMNGR